MDQVYRNTAWGDITIKDSDPQWIKDTWMRLLGLAPRGFVPSFRPAFGSDGQQQWPLNSEYFATKETAEYMATKYGTGQVLEVPFGGSGGLFSASADEYWIELPDGRKFNAGILAGFYERNPEDKFPGLAEKLIRKALER